MWKASGGEDSGATEFHHSISRISPLLISDATGPLYMFNNSETLTFTASKLDISSQGSAVYLHDDHNTSCERRKMLL